MIAADYLKRIAAWSRELNDREIEVARAGIVEKSYRANEFIFMRGDRLRLLDRHRHGSCPDEHGVERRQGCDFRRPHGRRLVWRGHDAEERAAPLRRGRVARYQAGADGSQHLLLAVREQRRVQPLSGPAAQRAARPVHRSAGTWPHPRCHQPRRALDRLAVQPDSLSGHDAPYRDHAGRNWSAVRYFAAECQPVPEAAGEGRPAAARIWRRHHYRA